MCGLSGTRFVSDSGPMSALSPRSLCTHNGGWTEDEAQGAVSWGGPLSTAIHQDGTRGIGSGRSGSRVGAGPLLRKRPLLPVLGQRTEGPRPRRAPAQPCREQIRPPRGSGAGPP